MDHLVVKQPAQSELEKTVSDKGQIYTTISPNQLCQQDSENVFYYLAIVVGSKVDRKLNIQPRKTQIL